MKEKLRNFTIYLLLGIFALGFIMMRAGGKHGNDIFTVIGIIVMVIIAVMFGVYYLSSRSKQRNIEAENRLNLADFKQKARAIKVNLEDVEIKTNNWTDTVVINNSQYGGLDELAGYADSNIMRVDRNLNSVKITIPVDGEEINYFVNIEMEPTTLAMHFAIRKETLLYIHGDELYLDLEFLK